MENTIVKAFANCKIVLHPCIALLGDKGDIFNIFSDIDMYETCPFIFKLLDDNWDKLIGLKDDKVHWDLVLKSPNAAKLIEHHWKDLQKHDKIYWNCLFSNTNDRILNIIDQHWDKLVAENKIFIGHLAANASKGAICLIEKHWDYIMPLLSNNNTHAREWLCENHVAATSGFIERHWHDIMAIKDGEYDAAYKRDVYYYKVLYNSTPATAATIDNKVGHLPINKDVLFSEHIWEILYNNPIHDKWTITLINQHWDIIKRIMESHLDFEDLHVCICSNPFICELDKANWKWLCDNNCVYWDEILKNPGALPIIERHWNTIIKEEEEIVNCLCSNTNPGAMAIIEKHWDLLVSENKISRTRLYRNPAAIKIIERELQQPGNEHFVVNYKSCLLGNPAILVDEYHAVATKYMCEHVFAELMARIWHPRNITRFASWGVDPDD